MMPIKHKPVATISLVIAALFSAQALAQSGTYIEALGQEVYFAPEVAPSAKPDADETELSKAIADKEQELKASAASNVKHANNVPSFEDDDAQVASKQDGELTASEIQKLQQLLAANRANTVEGDLLPNPNLEQSHQDQMVNELINEAAPLNAQSIRRLMKMLDERRGAALAPMNPGVLTKSRQCVIDLSPGATPCVVRVTPGIGALVSFTDTKGNPWPIKFTRNFFTQAGAVTQMSEHVLSVEANNAYQRGSVGVILKGLDTPISFMFTPGQEETDSRIDLKVPGVAPGSAASVGQISAPDIVQNNLSGYIYGGTPDGATLLKVTAPGSAQDKTRAWQSESGRLILRTTARVQSPGWYQSNESMDGTTVYELPATPVVRASIDGKIRSIRISGLKPVSKSTNN